MDFILRETGATTKDDLSVVLGEFDIRSGSDSFDTNRFDSFKGDFITRPSALGMSDPGRTIDL